jgi:DNA-entry nuclease
MRKKRNVLIAFMLVSAMVLTACGSGGSGSDTSEDTSTASSAVKVEQSAYTSTEDAVIEKVSSLGKIPAFADKPYVEINGNKPNFKADSLKAKSYERYGELDRLGRCTIAYACIGRDLMPEGERGSIGMIRPSGWQTIRYDFVDGKYLYNRCHLIGYQLTGENANERNLITGTRYMNVEGMLPFENMVADYIKETWNHVLYRVTPLYSGDDLVASGVHMMAESVEDKGDGVAFNVYVYNDQPGVKIDYATGRSQATGSQQTESSAASKSGSGKYIINVNTGKFHRPSCYSVSKMSDSNKKVFNGSRAELIKEGYEPCKNCNP